jgi:hypothetical protein
MGMENGCLFAIFRSMKAFFRIIRKKALVIFWELMVKPIEACFLKIDPMEQDSIAMLLLNISIKVAR